MEIHKTRLALEKEKELKAIEHHIDEELKTSALEGKLKNQKEELQRKLEEAADPAEKKAL